MIRFLARFFAKRAYIFNQEFQAATADLNAGLSDRTAAEKRKLVDQLTTEAEKMEARIKQVAEMEEKGFWLCENGHETPKCSLSLCDEHEGARCDECKYGKKICDKCRFEMKPIKRSEMSGQDKYESDKERKEAEKIAADKRQQAAAETENAEGSTKSASYFRGQAASNRALAEKIRAL